MRGKALTTIIKGQKFNRLTAIKQIGVKNNHSLWKFICDCGKEHYAIGYDVRIGGTKSCGCANLDRLTKGTPIELSARSVWRSIYSNDGCSFEHFMLLSQKNCTYCGSPPNQIANKNRKTSKRYKDGYFIYNGLDRIDSSKNHSENNVVTCCKICNYMKREYSVEFFLNHIEKISMMKNSKKDPNNTG
jgi:hypothetical protein